MQTISLCDISLLMITIIFLLGFGTFIAGVFTLAKRAWSSQMRSLTTQTARLVQKGMAEEIAGLVGNANALLSTLNDMVRTSNGIGIFLTILGLITMLLNFWLLLQAQSLCPI